MKRFPGTALLAVLIAIPCAQSQVAPDRDASPDAPFQISVDLNLVVLPVTIRDKKGGFVSDLRQQNFQVYEDGVLQSIRLFEHEDIPVTAGLVVDHSGSMHNKILDVLHGARAFVRVSNPQDLMFVVNFNERVTLGLPPAVPFTDKAEDLEAAIINAPVAGQTALYDAIDVALERLKTIQLDKKVLIVISDGGDNASVVGLAAVLKKAEESRAIIYTVGIFDENDGDKNPDVLKKLARESGGEAFFPSQFNEVSDICEGIAKDIRYQYTLGYVSGNTRAGGHRVVRVVAREPGKDLIARTRAGYIAGDSMK